METTCSFLIYDMYIVYTGNILILEFFFRFVDVVRSKTPKVTFYVRRDKFMLMENSPQADFEAVFDDGACSFRVLIPGIA